MAREQLNSASYNWNAFPDRPELAAALAGRVADRLTKAIAARGTALLAVSGGTTPAKFFATLSALPIAWDKVIVTLVDERFVPASSPRSNAGLVAANLLQNAAKAARFVPLYHEAAGIEDAATSDDAALRSLPWPLDVVILGMGPDGHTASFFPGGDHLAEALDLTGTAHVLPMHAPGAGEPRITFTLPTLLRTRALYLHIESEAKRDLLADARLGLGEAANYPVRAVLTQNQVPVAVYWCP